MTTVDHFQPTRYVMMNRFEQRLRRARDRFVSEAVQILADMAIQEIHDAFALASVGRGRLANASSEATPHRPQIKDKLEKAPPTATAQARVLACIREAPGSHIGELSSALGMRPSTIRRHLRKLVGVEAIRIEAKPDSRFGGQ